MQQRSQDTMSLGWRRLLWVFVACGLMFIPGCTDEEVAETATVVAVTAGIVALGHMGDGDADESNHENKDQDKDHNDEYAHRRRGGDGCGRGFRYDHDRRRCVEKRRHHHHHRGDRDGDRRRGSAYEHTPYNCEFERVCNVYFNFKGQRIRSCDRERVCYRSERGRWHSHSGMRYHNHYRHDYEHWHRRYAAQPDPTDTLHHVYTSMKKGASAGDLMAPHDFAQAFQLSVLATQRLFEALDQGRHGDLSALTEIGFSHQVLWDIAHGDMPTENQIEEIARSLDHMPELTAEMLRQMIGFSSYLEVGS